MEFLRKVYMVLVVSLVGTTIAAGQTPEQMQKAFKESYASELKGDYSGAINELKIISKTNSYEYNLRVGWLYYCLKNYSTSMDYYQKAIDLKQYSVEARLGFVTPANAAKQFDKAYAKYEEILKIDPYNSIANYWVGVNYYTVKKYDISAKYLELVVNMYPFDYDGNHMLGWAYLNLGKAGEAKLLFEKALLSKPDDVSAKDGLSKCK